MMEPFDRVVSLLQTGISLTIVCLLRKAPLLILLYTGTIRHLVQIVCGWLFLRACPSSSFDPRCHSGIHARVAQPNSALPRAPLRSWTDFFYCRSSKLTASLARSFAE